MELHSIMKVKTNMESCSLKYGETRTSSRPRSVDTATLPPSCTNTNSNNIDMHMNMDSSTNSNISSTSSSSTIHSSSASSSSSVRFSNITVREYPIIVGDNPSCSSGAPISIGWDYQTLPQNQNQTPLSIDDYEQFRPERRHRLQLRIPHTARHKMLRDEWGVSPLTILQTATSIRKVRLQRRRTAALPDVLFVAEDIVESTHRKWRRLIGGGRSSRRVEGDVPVYIRVWEEEERNRRLVEQQKE